MDAHNSKRRLELVLEKLKNPSIVSEREHSIDYRKISEKSRKTIIDFHEECFAEGLDI